MSDHVNLSRPSTLYHPSLDLEKLLTPKAVPRMCWADTTLHLLSSCCNSKTFSEVFFFPLIVRVKMLYDASYYFFPDLCSDIQSSILHVIVCSIKVPLTKRQDVFLLLWFLFSVKTISFFSALLPLWWSNDDARAWHWLCCNHSVMLLPFLLLPFYDGYCRCEGELVLACVSLSSFAFLI